MLRADGPEFLLQCADSSTHDSFRDTTPEKMRSRPSLPPFPLSVRSPACAHTGISDGPHVACVCIVSRMHYSDSGLLGCVGGILKCGTCCTIRNFCLLRDLLHHLLAAQRRVCWERLLPQHLSLFPSAQSSQHSNFSSTVATRAWQWSPKHMEHSVLLQTVSLAGTECVPGTRLTRDNASRTLRPCSETS